VGGGDLQDQYEKGVRDVTADKFERSCLPKAAPVRRAVCTAWPAGIGGTWFHVANVVRQPHSPVVNPVYNSACLPDRAAATCPHRNPQHLKLVYLAGDRVLVRLGSVQV
jgi:hypothetical protein